MRQGRITLILLTGIFLVAEIIFNYKVISIGDDDLFGASVKTLIFLILIFFFSKTKTWARWMLSIFLIIYGLLCLIVGFELDITFYFLGLYHIFFGIYIHKSKALSTFRITNPVLKMHENKGIFTTNGKLFESPRLVNRYKAVLIDGLLLLAILILIMVLVDDSPARTEIMVTAFFLFSFIYEPLLTAYSKTIGQRVMRIRVVQHNNPSEKINLTNAYIRWFLKGLLGWISFITIHFNQEKRAIHDLASDSVMINES